MTKALSVAEAVPNPSLKSTDQIKALRMLLKADKEARQSQLLVSLLGSPIIQVVGTVLACELMEKNEIIGSGWATGIETGTIALVGLHTLKNYGLSGLGVVGAAGLTGGILGDLANPNNIVDKVTDITSPTLDVVQGAGGFPGGALGLVRALWNRIF